MSERSRRNTHPPEEGDKLRTSSRTAGGVVAGTLGALGAWAFVTLVAVAWGVDPWRVAKVPGLLVTGARADAAGFDAGAVVAGLAVHWGVSVGWGLAFSLLFFGFSRAATLVFGLLWGLVVWAAMLFLIVPLTGASALVQAAPPWLAVLAHLVFGFFVALGYLPFQRRVDYPEFRDPLSA